ncbi:potassium channel family protein [Hydrocarboniclastica marina]|uniref:Two pore domain potassium channel family protein n=1 Tax=Hydrocarboniclastica marina TaxID=2259620 RepID=A0A4P7XL64_9ALTE|nr:potassium channel family protein [Hydrocarboniclastica marina]QCF27665.1 two pore domain potassium channel family protein [Hydrocarboniclastica marina]
MFNAQLVFGAFLIAIIMVDAIRSTLTTQGGGVLTRHLAKAQHGLMLWLASTTGRRSPLAISGAAAIASITLTWLLGLWLGWYLVFDALPGAVVNSQSKLPVDSIGKVYFVGFTLSTLGIGDLVPSGAAARILTPVAAFNGLLLATLAITYAVPLVSGAVQKRHFAYSVSSLGPDPVGLVRASWNGRNFNALESILSDLSSELLQLTEQRLAYPILDNFQTRERGGSLILQIAVLDEALSLLSYGVGASQRPDPVVVNNVRSAIQHYLSRTVGDEDGRTETPPLPDIQRLSGTGLEVVAEDTYAAELVSLARHRRGLKQALEREGWDWPGGARTS